MSALDRLAQLLQPAVQVGSQSMTADSAIDGVLAEMERKAKGRKGVPVPEDLQLEAVRRFWEGQNIELFRDAYLLSWGLCLPHRVSGPCILEDRPRFQRVLAGVDAWKTRPKAFRRCYQGLVKSYFTYDGLSQSAVPSGRQNWQHLRDYLHDRSTHILDKELNPDWVSAALSNRKLFGEAPYEPYVEALLHGDASAINHLCEQLGISEASWFLRELVLTQIRSATEHVDAQFKALLPRLIELLTHNEVLRDRGLILVLDRYAQMPGVHLHHGLRDSSVLWWGNPWLPSNETRWGGVRPEAREMVADWLKLEFIETFFTKLAEDGMGDRRRMDFWKRYVKSIDSVQFALGSGALHSYDRDFVALRKKMAGLICELSAGGRNNAFIMTMGNLVAVEFSGLGNALYGYDSRRDLPFDTAKPVVLSVDTRNSLKHSEPTRILRLSHQAASHHSDTWERMFESTLSRDFGIRPGALAPMVTHRRAPRPANLKPVAEEEVLPAVEAALQGYTQAYSRTALNKFTLSLGLPVLDKTSQGGNLWVHTEGNDPRVSQVLTRWGFCHKPGKGWWK